MEAPDLEGLNCQKCVSNGELQACNTKYDYRNDCQ
jgi:hypothetical protein